MIPSDRTLARRALPWLLLLYAAASLLHFAHNAEYLADYPNLPGWLSRVDVYLAWCGVTFVGVAGYVLYARSRELMGIALLAVYAALGFDGLLHYTRAPASAHTAAMNTTIWTEVAAAALLLAGVATLAAQWRPRASG
jgi:hypothetical protein